MKSKKKYTKRTNGQKGGVPAYLLNINRIRRTLRQSRRASASRRASRRESRMVEHTKGVNAHYREKLPRIIQSSIVNEYTSDPLLEKVERNIRNYALRDALLETIKESIQLLMEGCRSQETIYQNNEFYISIFSKISAIKFNIESIDISERTLIERQLLEVVQDNHDIDCSQMLQLLINLYAVYKIYKRNNENNFK